MRPPYDTVLADARDTIRAALGEDLHSLYLYGSVATGQAVPPVSDLDLAVIVTSTAARDRCGQLSEDLGRRHRATVREVGVSPGLLADVRAPGDAGRAERCFLRHYCAHVTGTDLRVELPRCRPDLALGREFVGDLHATVDRVRAELDAATSPSQVSAVAVALARRLLLAAAVLYSVVDGGWTTDRAAGAAMATGHHPDQRAAIRTALRWSATVPGDPVADSIRRAEVAAILDGPAARIASDARSHLRQGAPGSGS